MGRYLANWFEENTRKVQVKQRRHDPKTGITAIQGRHRKGRVPCNPEDTLVLVQNNTSSVVPLKVSTGDTSWQLSVTPGSIVFFTPGSPVDLSLSRPFGFLALSIPSKKALKATRTILKRHPTSRSQLTGNIMIDPFCAQALASLWHELGSQKTYRKLQIDGISRALVACFLNTLEHLAQTGSSGLPVHREMQSAVVWIQDNLHRKITLAELSQITDMPVAVFQRVFRNTFGQSVSKYTAELRIEKARSLVLAGRESYAEIATECGFHDQSHMIHAFKKRFGRTPGSLGCKE